jgi:hypothetical protein
LLWGYSRLDSLWRLLHAEREEVAVSEGSGLQGWHRFIGRWGTEGAHPMLPGEAIRGTSSFEWLDGQRFVIWRSHYDHSQIPDAITMIGMTDGQLSMHYFDQRGVYRVYAASLNQAKWRYWRDAPVPDFSQRFSGTFSDDGNTITAEVGYRRTGVPGRTILLSTIRGWRELDRSGSLRACVSRTPEAP